MKKITKIIIASSVLIVYTAALVSGFWVYNNYSLKKLSEAGTKDTDQKIALLQKQISGLQESVQQVSGDVKTAAALPEKEVVTREVIRQQSQEDQLTRAVSVTSPAVVSIVISKNVPQLEVTYVNPFGDDPFFKDFGFKVPQYKQKGSTLQKVGAGTGFLVTNNGYIVTNRHVVLDTEASYTVLLSDGKQKTATVVYRDPKRDIAIVKIDGTGYSSVSLGDSGNLKLGQSVLAIGNALGEYNNSVSTGIISGVDRKLEAQAQNGVEVIEGAIQTDAGINPGNSGGPLVNLSGEVIGVNVATVQGANQISFAIPINQVKEIIRVVVK